MEQKAGFPHDVDNVIILKDILWRIGVGTGAVHIDGTDALVLPGRVQNQVGHLLLRSHDNTPIRSK